MPVSTLLAVAIIVVATIGNRVRFHEAHGMPPSKRRKPTTPPTGELAATAGSPESANHVAKASDAKIVFAE
jgi:hypothetical protein